MSELIDLEALQALMESHHRATGINHALIDNDSRVLTFAGWAPLCTDFHRVHPLSCQRCEESDRKILQHMNDGPYVGYECLNGLMDYATPVIIEGEHVCNVFTGQMFHQPPNLEFFRLQAQEFGFDTEPYLEAVQRIPIVSNERMPDIMAFLVGLAQMLGQQGLMRLRQIEAKNRLLRLNEDLAQRVLERTEELAEKNRQLELKIIEREQVESTLRHEKQVSEKAQQALTDESTKNAILLRTASDGIYVLDMEGKVVLANDTFCRMLGYAADSMLGMTVQQWETQWSAQELQAKFSQPLDRNILYETRFRRHDDTVLEVEVHAAGVVIGGVPLLYAAARDITERKRTVERIYHLANYDILTNLPNRALLTERLQQALFKARRDKARLALMFLDIDKFKPVNDALGHDVGDLLLTEVATRLQGCMRESDTVARIGGDEFVVLLPSIENEQVVDKVAQKILSVLGQAFPVAGHVIDISASIGIAIYPEHGLDEKSLLKSADQAMYHAKHAGGSSVQLSTSSSRSSPPLLIATIA